MSWKNKGRVPRTFRQDPDVQEFLDNLPYGDASGLINEAIKEHSLSTHGPPGEGPPENPSPGENPNFQTAPGTGGPKVEEPKNLPSPKQSRTPKDESSNGSGASTDDLKNSTSPGANFRKKLPGATSEETPPPSSEPSHLLTSLFSKRRR